MTNKTLKISVYPRRFKILTKMYHLRKLYSIYMSFSLQVDNVTFRCRICVLYSVVTRVFVIIVFKYKIIWNAKSKERVYFSIHLNFNSKISKVHSCINRIYVRTMKDFEN